MVRLGPIEQVNMGQGRWGVRPFTGMPAAGAGGGGSNRAKVGVLKTARSRAGMTEWGLDMGTRAGESLRHALIALGARWGEAGAGLCSRGRSLTGCLDRPAYRVLGAWAWSSQAFPQPSHSSWV